MKYCTANVQAGQLLKYKTVIIIAINIISDGGGGGGGNRTAVKKMCQRSRQ